MIDNELAPEDRVPVSDCCAAELYHYNETDICPDCGEHCGILEED